MQPERREEVVQAIESVREVVASKLLRRMYADPFWERRFGEKGRAYAQQDAHHNLDNLIRAIQFDIPHGPTHHYSWLRDVLVHRGLSTLHLRQTIDRLGQALSEELPQEWPLIQPYLEAGYEGLVYENPACQALAEDMETVAQAVTADLEEQGASLYERKEERRQEASFLLSYLLDAVENQETKIFTNFVHWQRENHAAQGVPGDTLRWDLVLLEEEIENRIGRQEMRPFKEMIRKSRQQPGEK